MKALSKVGVATGILVILLVIYTGAYWFLFKSTTGSRCWGNDPFASDNWRDRIRPLFAPAAKAERWWTIQRQRGAFVGTWVSSDKRYRVTIKSNGSIRVWGFRLPGLSDGKEIAGKWLNSDPGDAGESRPVVLTFMTNAESSPYFRLIGDVLVSEGPVPVVSFRRDTTSGEVPEP